MLPEIFGQIFRVFGLLGVGIGLVAGSQNSWFSPLPPPTPRTGPSLLLFQTVNQSGVQPRTVICNVSPDPFPLGTSTSEPKVHVECERH
jgi:hypothetical protein